LDKKTTHTLLWILFSNLSSWFPFLIKRREGAGKRGALPLSKISSPSPFKERGIKGVRLINNLITMYTGAG